MKRLIAGILTTAFLAAPAAADEAYSTRDELLERFGWNLATAEIKTQKLGKGLYVLFGIGGNIGVSIGENGTLIVDDQFPELMPKIEAAIAKIGGTNVDFAINTHWHFDHADGNLAFGPGGTWLVSQANSRDMMLAPHIINLSVAKYRQQAYPSNARPVITFDDRMSFHFNGERIDLIHSGPAHTTGDVAVIFREHNAVHMGDVFNNTGYPFIDADNGGEIDGMIDFCETVLAELKPGAIVIPGHGEVTDDAALRRYIEMLKTVRGRISEMIAKGMSVEEVIAAKPTADLDDDFGDVANSLGFVDRVYTSLNSKEKR
jgi:glyoxylase-like metal-dependent hydrolase (beta-lactamase superfamily II)